MIDRREKYSGHIESNCKPKRVRVYKARTGKYKGVDEASVTIEDGIVITAALIILSVFMWWIL